MGTNKEVSFITSSASPISALGSRVDDDIGNDRLSKKKRQDKIDNSPDRHPGAGAERIKRISLRFIRASDEFSEATMTLKRQPIDRDGRMVAFGSAGDVERTR